MGNQYFENLNYTMANEDTAMEVDMLAAGVNHVMCVAGSGGRVMPLLSKAPRKITCVDLSEEQLGICQLRFEALRAFEFDEYLDFFGYPREGSSNELAPEVRKKMFGKISLSDDVRKMYSHLFDQISWSPITYMGKWEKTFIKLSLLNRSLTRRKGAAIFECKSIEEQNEYLQSKFPKLSWNAVLMAAGNASVFNSLLYKGHFPKRNIPETYFEFYRKSFGRIFKSQLLRENFFMQILFFGKIKYPEGVPVEGKEDVFSAAKKVMDSVEIQYQRLDILGAVKQTSTPIDFLSLSDVPSYFDDQTGNTFLQSVRPGMAPGGKVIVRNYIHVHWRTDSKGYEVITSDFHEAIAKEKTQVYLVDVYKAIS